jgi:hypothetical protein
VAKLSAPLTAESQSRVRISTWHPRSGGPCDYRWTDYKQYLNQIYVDYLEDYSSLSLIPLEEDRHCPFLSAGGGAGSASSDQVPDTAEETAVFEQIHW